MRRLCSIIFAELRRSAHGLSFVGLLTLIMVGLEALEPWPYKFLVDNVLGGQRLPNGVFYAFVATHFSNPEKLGFLVVVVFFTISITEAVLTYVHGFAFKRVLNAIVQRFSATVFRRVEALSMGFYRKQKVGDYVYRLSNDSTSIGELVEDGIVPLVTSSLYVVITSVVLLLINWKLGLLSLAALPFLVGSLYLLNAKIVRATRKVERWNSTLFSFIEQTLGQLKSVQAFNQEARQGDIFDYKLHASLGADFRQYGLGLLLSLLVAIIIAISYSLIILFGIKAVLGGELSAGLLIVFVFYLDNLTSPALSFVYSVASLREEYTKIGRLRQFFVDTNQAKDLGTITQAVDARVRYLGVSLTGEEGVEVLHDVSFDVVPGRLTVLIGESGSGKTSAALLLPRLAGGRMKGIITLGGRDASEYGLAELRQQIGLVPQETALFNDTVKEIIRFGKSGASLAEIRQAAELACADEFVDALPGGYNYSVGEDGSLLSGGQRQRLLLARAFLKDAPVLILDEPFSALDLKTKARVNHSIRRLALTRSVLLITNVTDILEPEDLVITLSHGRVAHRS